MKQITITNDKGRLSKDEVDKLLRDSEKFKEQDELSKKKIESKNSLEQYIYSVKHTVEDEKFKGKITDEEKKKCIDLCTKQDTWLHSN